jgi:hypothetical protein
VESSSTSLYGRTKYCIKRKDGKQLPVHSFKVGDEAELYNVKLRHTPEADSSRVSGIICKVTTSNIEMVSDEQDEVDLQPSLRLDKRASEATYKKMLHTLHDINDPANTTAWPLIDILFSDKALDVPQAVSITPFNTNLNSSQVQ